MNVRVRSILEHMLEDANDAVEFAGDLENAAALSGNKLYRKAIIMSVINIGELAKNLPDDYKSAHNGIPWKKISGMRDIAAHGYHVMDDNIIWDVLITSIPELIRFLEDQLL